MLGCLKASLNVGSIRLVLLVEHCSLGKAKNHHFCHQNEGTVEKETTPPTNVKENWLTRVAILFYNSFFQKHNLKDIGT